MTSSVRMRARIRGAAVAAAAAALTSFGLAAPAAAATTTVTPGNLGSWAQESFDCDDGAERTGAQAFVEGPETPPAGAGSLAFGSAEAAEDHGEGLISDEYDGVALATVEGLAYSTYVNEAGQTAPELWIYVDENGDGDDADLSSLTFYPESNGTVTPDEWQTWTIDPTTGDFIQDGAEGSEVTLAEYLAENPDAEIFDISVEYGCGANTAGRVANVDKIVVDVADSEADTFDLEPGEDPDQPTGSNGYRMVAADGGIFTFGQRTFHGSTGNMTLNKPIVGGATDVSDYDGYWIVASDGGVFTFNAEFHGSLGNQVLTSPAVEIEPTPTGTGYWIVQANGKVTAFGGAKHHGDMSDKPLNKPIIGMSVAPDGLGYWLVAEDGGIFNFGSADFFGSTGDKKLNAPVIDLAPMPDGEGYYLVARDGGVFTFGTATFWGSTGNMTLNQPVIAMLVLPTGAGYWLAASDGGIFSFGPQADFLGSMGGTKLNAPVLDLIN